MNWIESSLAFVVIGWVRRQLIIISVLGVSFMHTDLLTLLIASKHTRFDKEKIKCYDSSAVDGVQLSEAIMPKRPFTTLFTRVHLHLAKCKWRPPKTIRCRDNNN